VAIQVEVVEGGQVLRYENSATSISRLAHDTGISIGVYVHILQKYVHCDVIPLHIGALLPLGQHIYAGRYLKYVPMYWSNGKYVPRYTVSS
jgi:hypothetical protein